jgi:hypothetical protein
MPGALDGNGVYKYAEDDLLSPWSTYMNLGMNSISNAIAGIVGGAWVAYTPVLTGVTLGTGGTVEAAYLKFGKTYIVRVEITLGTGGTITGEVSFTLPVTAKQGRRTGTAVGRITNGGNPYQLVCWSASSTTAQLIRYVVPATGVVTALSASAPGTWANSGWIEAEVVMEGA